MTLQNSFEEYHYGDDTDYTNGDALPGCEQSIIYTSNGGGGAGIFLASGSNTTVKNNIIVAQVETGVYACYTLQTTDGNVLANSDYNTYYKGANANLVDINGTLEADLAAWGDDGANDLEGDPKFVTDGTDFHIRSIASGASFHNGEWPPLTAASGTWTDDSDVSPCVDAGTGTYDFEPEDNGDIRNQGCYGDTYQATRGWVVEGIWTGNVSTAWDNLGNWSDGVIPTGSCESGPGSFAIIPDVSGESGNFPYITVAAEVEDFTIEANANVQIAPTGSLFVEFLLIRPELLVFF